MGGAPSRASHTQMPRSQVPDALPGLGRGGRGRSARQTHSWGSCVLVGEADGGTTGQEDHGNLGNNSEASKIGQQEPGGEGEGREAFQGKCPRGGGRGGLGRAPRAGGEGNAWPAGGRSLGFGQRGMRELGGVINRGLQPAVYDFNFLTSQKFQTETFFPLVQVREKLARAGPGSEVLGPCDALLQPKKLFLPNRVQPPGLRGRGEAFMGAGLKKSHIHCPSEKCKN